MTEQTALSEHTTLHLKYSIFLFFAYTKFEAFLNVLPINSVFSLSSRVHVMT